MSDDRLSANNEQGLSARVERSIGSDQGKEAEMSKHNEATEAVLEALSAAVKKGDADMTKAAAEALDALSRRAFQVAQVAAKAV